MYRCFDVCRRRRPPAQQVRKRYDGRCQVCGEDDYAQLDAHRILPGSEGGKYSFANILTLCVGCHRKIDSGRLKVHGRHTSTLGEVFLHYTLDGEERWQKEVR